MKMKHNKGQGLIEYMLVLLMCAVVVIVIIGLFIGASNIPPCNRAGDAQTAGAVVDCIGTRTAEARHK